MARKGGILYYVAMKYDIRLLVLAKRVCRIQEGAGELADLA